MTVPELLVLAAALRATGELSAGRREARVELRAGEVVAAVQATAPDE